MRSRLDSRAALLAIVILGFSVPALAQTTACDFCEVIGPRTELAFYAPPGVALTIDPAGTGDRLEDLGITLSLRLVCPVSEWEIVPIGGVSAQEIVLYDPRLCLVFPMTAARPTDAQGRTEFTGTFLGGGCTDRVRIYAGANFLVEVPLRINSPDSGTASPCAVDAGDLSAFASRLGVPSRYDFCFDYNDDGAIDGSDLSRFAMSLGSTP
jgi:hypothetical protein